MTQEHDSNAPIYSDPTVQSTRIVDTAPTAHHEPSAQRSASHASGSLDGARFAPGTILAGRYRLVAMLGRGGMGEVYRAEDLKLGEPVALKFLPEHLSFDAAALARFHREVRVARQIAHRNVCRVHDIGEAEGYHFLTMEYIDGEDLSTLLSRIGRLPQDKATELALQVCSGLAAAHEAGVVHRDLKPANVMIDGKGRAKITDFGLANLQADLADSDQDHFAGTPAYMAPEQLRGGLDGESLGPRTDVYALGLVLFEMFTGQKAFPDEDWRRLVARGGRGGPPTDPSSLVDGLDPRVVRALLRCLEEDPKDRPSGALKVAAALPGGDPLRAAMEAGETPSPEMVAGVAGRQALSLRVGAALLVLAVSVVVGWQLAAEHMTFLAMVDPEKHPQALQDRAESLLDQLSWHELGAASAAEDGGDGAEAEQDTAWSFVEERRRLLTAEAGTVAEWRRRIDRRPALVTFFYRSSPFALAPPDGMWQPTLEDPAPRPGDALVKLDTSGRLEQLRLDAPGGPPAGESPDWNVLFGWADLDPTAFVELPTPDPDGSLDLPVHDARFAWRGRTGAEGAELEIDAASFGSLPVYFRLLEPSEGAAAPSLPYEISLALPMAFLVVLSVAVFAAARNVRSGRADVAGAVRLGSFLAAVALVGNLLTAHHTGGFDELLLLLRIFSNAAFRGVAAVVLYLAMEPTIRRRCPDLIVSWTRVLKGRWNDPLVGRDVLLGIAAGPAFVVGYLLVERALGNGGIWMIYALPVKLAGLGPISGMVAANLFVSTAGILAAAWVFSLADGWLRRRWITVVVLVGVAMVLSGANAGAILVVTLLGTAGLVAAIAGWLAVDFVIFFPATADPSVWWAWPNAWLVPLCVLALAVVAFRNATGVGAASARSA